MTENTPWIIEYMRNRTAYVPPTIKERRARHDAYREQAKAEIEKARQDILDWTAKWPDHCPYCKGHGGTYSEYDPSPAGVGLAPGTMTDFEPCEHCIGADAGKQVIVIQDQEPYEETFQLGYCPRCHKLMNAELDNPCPHCGWDWDNGLDDAAPRIPDYDWETFADFDVILQMERAEEEAWNCRYYGG